MMNYKQQIIDLYPDGGLVDQEDWPGNLKLIEDCIQGNDLPAALYMAAHCAIYAVVARDDERLNQVVQASTMPLLLLLTTGIRFHSVTDYVGEESEQIKLSKQILDDIGEAVLGKFLEGVAAGLSKEPPQQENGHNKV